MDVTCNAAYTANATTPSEDHYANLRFAVPGCGCLYDSHQKINPTIGMSIPIGRTTPTFPGEKLCATIIW